MRSAVGIMEAARVAVRKEISNHAAGCGSASSAQQLGRFQVRMELMKGQLPSGEVPRREPCPEARACGGSVADRETGNPARTEPACGQRGRRRRGPGDRVNTGSDRTGTTRGPGLPPSPTWTVVIDRWTPNGRRSRRSAVGVSPDDRGRLRRVRSAGLGLPVGGGRDRRGTPVRQSRHHLDVGRVRALGQAAPHGCAPCRDRPPVPHPELRGPARERRPVARRRSPPPPCARYDAALLPVG